MTLMMHRLADIPAATGEHPGAAEAQAPPRGTGRALEQPQREVTARKGQVRFDPGLRSGGKALTSDAGIRAAGSDGHIQARNGTGTGGEWRKLPRLTRRRSRTDYARIRV